MWVEAMQQEIIIGVSITITVAVIVAVKALLHTLLKFKMDESAILNFFKESGGDHTFQSTEVISEGTGLDVVRVSKVCTRSKSIRKNTRGKDSWFVKQS